MYDEERFVLTCDEERYVLTPKGIASLALNTVGLLDDIDDGRFESFWIVFEAYMKSYGYLVEN